MSDLAAQVEYKTIALPPFSKFSPLTWFTHVEELFREFNVSNDDVKFQHIVVSVDIEVLREVDTLVLTPPATDKYENLKRAIISATCEADEKRYRTLLAYTSLKSQLQSFQQVKHVTDTVDVDGLYVAVVPKHVNNLYPRILRSTGDLGDLVSIGKPKTERSSIFTNFAKETDISDLTERIEKLNVQGSSLHSLIKRQRSRSRNRSRSRRRSISRRRGPCWYHRTFKHKAKNCVSPCSWGRHLEINSE